MHIVDLVMCSMGGPAFTRIIHEVRGNGRLMIMKTITIRKLSTSVTTFAFAITFPRVGVVDRSKLKKETPTPTPTSVEQ